MRRTAKLLIEALAGLQDSNTLIGGFREARAGAEPEGLPGIDRMIARVERDRTVACPRKFAAVPGLLGSPVRKEPGHRFGPASAPPRVQRLARAAHRAGAGHMSKASRIAGVGRPGP